MTFRGILVGGVVLAVMAMTVPGPVRAQGLDAAALRDRIERLERDIRTLNVQIARGGGEATASAAASGGEGGSQPAYARLNTRVSELEGELRNMTGRLEEISFKLSQVTDRLGKLTADVDFRLSQLEQGGGKPMRQGMPDQMQGQSGSASAPQQNAQSASSGEPAGGDLPAGTQVLGTLSESDAASAGPPPSEASPEKKSEADALLEQLTGEGAGGDAQAAESAPAPEAAPSPSSVDVSSDNQPSAPAAAQTASLPDGTPREKYMHAFGLLRQSKYDLAADALRNFLEQHGDDKLASNARYWLGETYYVRGSYVEAAETFLEGYETDKQGPKAPDALLKLGMSLASLNNKTEACAVFQKLRSDYPDTTAGLKSTLEREWQKNGCA